MHACMPTYTYVSPCLYTQTCAHASTHIRILMSRHTYICIWTHAYTHAPPDRRAEDIQYTMYLVRRGMEEHHDCIELMCFHLVMLRYVGKDSQSANLAEKTMLTMQGLRMDCSFLLYAVQR